MVAWLSWLFGPHASADELPSGPQDELRILKSRRRELLNHMDSLRAYGFDSIAVEDEATLKTLDRKIATLQLKAGVAEDLSP